MNRTHLSTKLVESLHDVEQPNPHGDTMKPRGLWYQVDGDWERWMDGEQWYAAAYQHVYALDLADAKVLTIGDVQALDALTEQYAIGRPWHESLHDAHRYGTLDWPRLAREHDGLEIAPYIWERRLDYMWYYGWDCASGVLWRPRGAKLTLIGDFVRRKALT